MRLSFWAIFGLLLLVNACAGPKQPVTSMGEGSKELLGQPQETRSNPPSAGAANFDFGPFARFNRLSLEQGLSQSTVWCMFQDSLGFIWFGTEDGLNKFDGYGFKIFRHDPDDANSLSFNDISAIVEDRNGALWIGTNGRGLNRLDRSTERFTRYFKGADSAKGLSYDDVGALLVDPEGVLWIGTQGGGLDRYDLAAGQFTHYRNDPNNPDSLANNVIFAMIQDENGVLWLGTGNGIDRFDPKIGKFTHYLNESSEPNKTGKKAVSNLIKSKSGLLWVGMEDGLHQLDPQTGKESLVNLGIGRVKAIHESKTGFVWVGTFGDGLIQWNPVTGRITRYQNDPIETSSLSSNQVVSLFEDRSGDLWVGNYGAGANQLSRSNNQFINYRNDPRNPNSLSDNMVWSIAMDPAGAVWIGTNQGGLNSLDRKTGVTTRYLNDPKNPNSLGHNVVMGLFVDQEGSLWAGTRAGLDRLDRQTGNFIHYRNDPNDPQSISSNYVLSVIESADGTLWIATADGLNRFDRATGQFARYKNDPTNPDSLGSNIVRGLVWDSRGLLWVGTYSGVDCYDPKTGKFSHYNHDPTDPSSLSDNSVMAILEDHAGVIWVGTTGGLNRLDRETGRFRHYRVKQGLPNDYVYAILEDNQGYLWMSTNMGLARLDPRRETFTNFDRRDGLQSNEFNGATRFKAPDGELFFGGINGVNSFYPEQIQPGTYVPPVVLTSITQGGERLDLDSASEFTREITLTWPRNYFEFEFSALNYAQPDRNQYTYLLEDFDREWSKPGNRRYGKYTNLPGGTYVLRLKGSNNTGVWNEKGTSLIVQVVPPYWERLEFQVGVVLLLGLAVLVGFRLRVRDIQSRNRQLAQQVSERTREIDQRRQVAEGLREILVRLNHNQPLEESLNFIVCQVNRLSQAERVCLFQVEDDRARLSACYQNGVDLQDPCRKIEDIEGTYPGETLNWMASLVRNGTIRLIDDLPIYQQDHPGLSTTGLEGIGTMLLIPITLEGEIYGGLGVMFTHPKKVSKDELDMFNSFADQAALAIGNAQLRAKAEELAIVSERNRLARDLHDAVTQTLFSASLIAEALPPLWDIDPAEGRQLLKDLRQLTRGALAEMRTLLMELRPTAMVEAKMTDLLRQLAEAVTGRTGIAVRLDVQGNNHLPHDVKNGLYRIAQEALTNVVKHAAAKNVSLSLHCIPADVHDTLQSGDDEILVMLEVCDDGRGFDPENVPPDHFGLVNIRERAQAIGASLEISSQPGKGTQLRTSWQGRASNHGG